MIDVHQNGQKMIIYFIHVQNINNLIMQDLFLKNRI